MSDVSALSSASLGRLLTPVGQTADAAETNPRLTQAQANEQAQEQTREATTVGTDAGSTPTGGRGQFVDVVA